MNIVVTDIFQGYRASHRNRWLLLSHEVLSEHEWLLYEYFLDMSCWNAEFNKFGVFEFFPKEIIPIFNKGVETIQGWCAGLLQKGFIRLYDEDRKLYEIKNPARYLFDGRKGGKASVFKKEESAVEKEDELLEIILDNLCFYPERLRKNPEKVTPSILREEKAISSYNGSISSSLNKKVAVKQLPRTRGEYQRIYKEGGYVGLTPDDMEWIDINQTFTN